MNDNIKRTIEAIKAAPKNAQWWYVGAIGDGDNGVIYQPDLQTLVAELDRYRGALEGVVGCFDAAEFEDIDNRLADEFLPVGIGSLKDLIERRLLPAKQIAQNALDGGEK